MKHIHSHHKKLSHHKKMHNHHLAEAKKHHHEGLKLAHAMVRHEKSEMKHHIKHKK
jgi:hypothetical protein